MDKNLGIPKLKIIVEQKDSKATFEISGDSDIEDFRDLFAAILSFLTFSPDTIKELLYEETEE